MSDQDEIAGAPRSVRSRAVRWGVFVVLVLAAVVGAFRVMRAGELVAVHVVNGLEVPLDVVLGDEHIAVAPGAIVQHAVDAGPLHISAVTPAGLVIEEIDVDVPGRADAVVYNPLGAAPVFEHDVVFVNEATDEEAQAAQRVVPPLGTSWQVFENIDVVFEPAPTKVDMGSGDHVTTRSRLGHEQGGWPTTTAWLAQAGRPADAARIAAAVATVPPVHPGVVHLATQFAHAAGDDALAVRVATRAVELAPDDVAVARVLQEVLRLTLSGEQMIARYRAAYDAAPDSAGAAYLLARLLTLDEARPLYERSIAADSASPWPRRGLGMMLATMGEFADARPQLEAVVDEPGHGEVLWDLTAALVATGDVAAAQALLREKIEGRAALETDWPTMVSYERLRVAHPELTSPPVDALLVVRPGVPTLPDRERALLAAQAGDDAKLAELAPALDEGAVAACNVTLAAARDLDDAVTQAASLSADATRFVPDEAALQLTCEFARVGQTERADAFWESLSDATRAVLPRTMIDALPALPGSEVYLPPALRGALVHAAARRTDDPAEKARLMALARKLDPFHAVLPAGE